jgi:hypothetical protein
MSRKLEILEMLKSGNCTTEMISNRFGKHAMRKLRALREDGYQIEGKRLSFTNFAYTLIERPVVVPLVVADQSRRRTRIVTRKATSPAKRLPERKFSCDERVSDLEWWNLKRTELSRMLWRI